MDPLTCVIQFPGTQYPSIALECHQPLADHLTVQNSPVLFGCRTGICGTCLVEVTGDLPPPQPEEREMLDILAADNPLARLACQVDLVSDITLTVVEGHDPSG